MKGLKLGDVVYLKSGGPPMTVSNIINSKDITENTVVDCVFFDCNSNVRHVDFTMKALTKTVPIIKTCNHM